MTWVVDANIVVKWYVDEIGSEQARLVFEAEGLLVAPGHILGEVGEVLLGYSRRDQLSPAQLDIIKVALPGTLLLVSLDELFEPAIEIAQALRISFYDALYVAAAERWDTVLVTADQRLVKAASSSRWETKTMSLDTWTRQAHH